MKTKIHPLALPAALAAVLLGLTAPAQAQSAGTWLLRGGVSKMSPQVSSGDLSAPSFIGTKVDVHDNTQLGGGIGYMLTDHWALDVPLAVPFKHELVGAGAIAGVGKIGEAKVVPMTLFLQYRFLEPQARVRPYAGLGVSYARFFKERTTAALSGLTGGTPSNPTTLSAESRFGVTPQIGVQIGLTDRWYLDLAYYKTFLKTTAKLSSGQSIDLKLNPNIFAVAVGYQF